jgi:hypothetical protein
VHGIGFTVFAGTATPGFGGDGGPANSAQLNGPFAVTVDSLGNVFITDAFNHRVRMVDASGVIHTVLGGDGTLAFPLGVAADSFGDLFVADVGHYRVLRLFRASLPELTP